MQPNNELGWAEPSAFELISVTLIRVLLKMHSDTLHKIVKYEWIMGVWVFIFLGRVGSNLDFGKYAEVEV